MTDFLHLFEAFGVELEYMIVDRTTLDVLPVVDEVIRRAIGQYQSDVDRGAFCWSNELVNHVIEFKTMNPAASLNGLAEGFQNEVRAVNALLEPMGGRLMPTGMHPWMNPWTEARLWTHEYNAVYESFNRIFDCKGHGWSNLQSAHLNLPFANDEEFGRLHAAVRLALPILPALAASSPAREGRTTGFLDTRLETYRANCRRVPSVTGRVIPEPVFTEQEYRSEILQPMYKDIAPLDPEGVLREEWLNARGAIARFDRNTIEIRVLDVQECPAADLAILAAVAAVVEACTKERWTNLERQKNWPTERLESIFLSVVREGDAALLRDREYLESWGARGTKECSAGELWRRLIDDLSAASEDQWASHRSALDVILHDGCLARRILRALPDKLDPTALRSVYERLCQCMDTGAFFIP